MQQICQNYTLMECLLELLMMYGGGLPVAAAPAGDGREREARREALGHREDVGPQPGLVVAREAPPRAPEARLHLVDYEQQAVRVADAAHAREEGGRRGHVAALAEVALQLEEKFGSNSITVDNILAAPTVAAMAARITLVASNAETKSAPQEKKRALRHELRDYYFRRCSDMR